LFDGHTLIRQNASLEDEAGAARQDRNGLMLLYNNVAELRRFRGAENGRQPTSVA
jgi:hypothetical protein